MNTVKKISVSALRWLLLVLAPEFLFSQAMRRASLDSMAANHGRQDTQRQQTRAEIYPSKETQMAEFVVTYRGAVYSWQCDHMGYMNVMWYVGKFDEASWQLLSHLGLTRSRFSSEGRGAVAVEQRIDYRRELHAGDLVTIRSKVLDVNQKTIRMTHEMTNDETGELGAVAVIVGLYIDAHLRRACPLPSEVHQRAALLTGGACDLNINTRRGFSPVPLPRNLTLPLPNTPVESRR